MNEIEVHVAELEQFFDHMDASPLATRNLDPRAQEEGPFDADPDAVAKTRERIDAFLERFGYISR